MPRRGLNISGFICSVSAHCFLSSLPALGGKTFHDCLARALYLVTCRLALVLSVLRGLIFVKCAHLTCLCSHHRSTKNQFFNKIPSSTGRSLSVIIQLILVASNPRFVTTNRGSATSLRVQSIISFLCCCCL